MGARGCSTGCNVIHHVASILQVMTRQHGGGVMAAVLALRQPTRCAAPPTHMKVLLAIGIIIVVATTLTNYTFNSNGQAYSITCLLGNQSTTSSRRAGTWPGRAAEELPACFKGGLGCIPGRAEMPPFPENFAVSVLTHMW